MLHNKLAGCKLQGWHEACSTQDHEAHSTMILPTEGKNSIFINTDQTLHSKKRIHSMYYESSTNIKSHENQFLNQRYSSNKIYGLNNN